MQKKNREKFRDPRSDRKKISPPFFAMQNTGQSHRKACKLNCYWKICGTFRATLQGSKFFEGPFLHQATLTSVCERFLRQTNIF